MRRMRRSVKLDRLRRGRSGKLVAAAATAIATSALVVSTVSAAGQTSQPTLTVTLAGTGVGSVASTQPDGRLDCGSTCTASFAAGALVTVVATPHADPDPSRASHFEGWDEACSGTAPICTIVLQHDQVVGARFAPGPTPFPTQEVAPSRWLMISRAGEGSVMSEPIGIDCGTDCSETFAQGSTVTLAAEAAPGWAFAGWTAPCGPDPTCHLTVGEDASISVAFRHLYEIATRVDGNGTVVADQPPLTTCRSACSGLYRSDLTVLLRAAAAAGSHFEGWSGDCTGAAPTCAVAADATTETTAHFALGGPSTAAPLRVTTTRGGTVNALDGRISCGAVCSSVIAGAVSLTAVADPGFAFAGWSGACSGTGSCTVAAAPADIRATFRHVYGLDVFRQQSDPQFAPGPVTSAPPGIACGTKCSSSFRSDVTLTLTAASPPGGALFSYWAGGCVGETPVSTVTSGLCLVPLDADTAITAVYRPPVLGVVTYPVNVTVFGPGHVVSSPAGIDCGLQCSVAATNRVILTAEPVAGRSLFRGWSGACTGLDACVVRPPVQPVSATFVPCELGLTTLSVKRPQRQWVVVKFVASGDGTVAIVVARRGGKVLATRTVTAGSTLQKVTLKVPKNAKLTVGLSGKDACGNGHQFATKQV